MQTAHFWSTVKNILNVKSLAHCNSLASNFAHKKLSLYCTHNNSASVSAMTFAGSRIVDMNPLFALCTQYRILGFRLWSMLKHQYRVTQSTVRATEGEISLDLWYPQQSKWHYAPTAHGVTKRFYHMFIFCSRILVDWLRAYVKHSGVHSVCAYGWGIVVILM